MFDINKIKTILDEHQVSCAICKQRNFTAEPSPQSLSAIDLEKNATMVGSGYVVAIVSCNNCGYLLQFRASSLQ